MSSRYAVPAIIFKENKNARLVGVEIEMSGIELPMIVCQTVIAYGGKIDEISPYEFIVRDSKIGDVKIELDSRYLKKVHKEKFSQQKENSQTNLEDYTADIITALSKNVIPCEIATAPIPINEIERLDKLVQLLRDHGAKGTRYSVFFAFGVHLNPELPNLQIETILNYFKAFLCLQDSITDKEKLDYTRKVSPFINLFPLEFILKVLSSDYQPTIEQFIDDYLFFNASRNRILDLLPLLAFLHEKKVVDALPDEKINKRPTFHYRLPNSDIDNPNWGLWESWNGWAQVEELANNSELLEKICEAYISVHNRDSDDLISIWIQNISDLLKSR